MKKVIGSLALVIVVFVSASAQKATVQKLWTTDTILKIPESVLVDDKENCIWVSNIDGASNGKDGKGSISKLSKTGTPINLEWITGLNAPKGMAKFKQELYVADLTELVVIDIKKATIIKRVPIEGSVFLNDVTVNNKGAVFVSDSRTGKVHRYENNTTTIEVENLQGPNGLLSIEDQLLILDRGSLLSVTPSGAISKIMDGMDPSTDGIERVAPNQYLVSCWNGIVYYVVAGAQKITLFDTRSEKINSADIGYDAKKKIIYVPTFLKNNVVAYQLEIQ
ncbi:MAG: ATP/GTP-binding protein [Sediminibacterium sp.]|nr:ATP/GTP-binding protein [Sediminibacterium sp.]